MIDKNKIKHIFFDLDHTLWDFDANSKVAFQKIFSDLFTQIDLDKFLARYVFHNQECWKLYQTDQITHDELRYNRLKFTFNDLKFEISDETIDTISHHYIEILPDSNYLFNGAIEILDYLKSKYTLHIITNGFSGVQERKMTNANINHYFHSVTNSEMAGVKKPNPLIFNHALHLANASLENSIMIGDSLEADIQGAKNIGMSTIFFNSEKINHDFKTIEINHLLELKKWL